MEERGVETVACAGGVDGTYWIRAGTQDVAVHEHGGAVRSKLQCDAASALGCEFSKDSFGASLTGHAAGFHFVRKEDVEHRQERDGARVGQPVFVPADVEREGA